MGTEGDDMTDQERERLDVEIKDLREEVESLHSQLSQAHDEVDELTEKNEKLEGTPEVAEAVDNFLSLVERPTGKLSYTVPPGYQTDRAILALFDATNRNP
jgi:archaellum component FlaC